MTADDPRDRLYPPAKTAADALLGRGVAMALLALLEEKGIISRDEKHSLLDEVALKTFDTLGLPDPGPLPLRPEDL